MNKNAKFITLSVLLMSVGISMVDGVFKTSYFTKSVIKVLMFIPLPLLYFFKSDEGKNQLKQLFTPVKKYFFKSLILAFAIYAFMVGGYFMTKDVIDFSSVTTLLTQNMGVNKNNFIYVSLYIAFVNSLVEEFFFRGYAFLALKKHVGRKFAYIFSALMFALYHSGMTDGWFNFPVFLLMIAGLFVGGCIFNFLNEKCENIYPSWLVHMFANFGINTVGFILFGIIQ